MAATTNLFKNAIARQVGTTEVVLYIPPSGQNSVVVQFDIANTTGGAITVTAYLKRAGVIYNLLVNGAMTTGETLQIIYGQKLVLQDGDSLCVLSNTATSCDAIVSVLENVNN